MSATCNFCGQQFGNSQAVKAHLKGCAAYRKRPTKALARKLGTRQSSLGSEPPGTHSLGNESGENESGFNPVRQLQLRLAAERLRLQLREVEDAHAELDRRGAAKERERTEMLDHESARVDSEARAKESAQRLATDAAERAERRATAERERQERRRANLQAVKRRTLENWVPGVCVTSDIKGQMLRDIELELSALPVEDLPVSELVQIAEGIRDRHYREVEEQHRRAGEQLANRQRLIRHGKDYSSRQLREVEGLDVLARTRIELRIWRELEQTSGDESQADIEGLVEDILEDEDIEQGNEDIDEDDDE